MEQEPSIMEIVLNNVMEELKEARLQQAAGVKAISLLQEKVEGFEQKLSNLKITVPPVTTLPITNSIDEGIDKLKSAIEAQPVSIKKEHRILLFPEHGAREYYALVFGRVLFWLVIILTATYLFFLGKEYIQINAVVRQVQVEESPVRRVKKNVYKHKEKASKEKMDSAYIPENIRK